MRRVREEYGRRSVYDKKATLNQPEPQGKR